jgi:hypothetical protein
MRTYVYRIQVGSEVFWAPTDPANVKFAFSVLGEATMTDVQPGEEALSGGFVLSSSNPFVAPGAFNLKLSRAAEIRVEIFDVAGRSVKVLREGRSDAGLHELRWDASDERGLDLPSGLYFVRAQVGEANQVRKVVLLQ